MTHHPTGPKIRYGMAARIRELAEQAQPHMHAMITNLVGKGGLCALNATLPNGKEVKHEFSVPAGLTYQQVDSYLEVEAEMLNSIIESFGDGQI